MTGGQSSGLKACYWLTLFSGLLECLCFSGIMFGWASLVFVLKSDGYFSNLCVNSTVNGTVTKDCTKQDEQFSIIFTISSSVNNFFTLPNGFLFDHFGTTATRLLGIAVYTTGTLLVAFSNAALSVVLYPALAFIAVGGILFLVTNMQVGNLFGNHRSTVITLYNGAFDSSSAVFLLVKLLYQVGVSLRYFFLFLSCCSVVHLIRTFLLMPRKHIPYPLPQNFTYGLKCGTLSYASEQNIVPTLLVTKPHQGQKDQTPSLEVPGEKTRLLDNQPADSEPLQSFNNCERSFKSCVLSWFFLWHLLWLSIIQLRHYLFIGTLNPTLNRLTAGDPKLVSSYTNAFAYTQLCGILCAPWNGLIMDRHKGKPREKGESENEADLKAAILSLFLTSLQCVLFSLCAAIPFLPLQYLTFILQVINRSFLYGGNAAFITLAFPTSHFGKLFGTVMALSALVSLLQYPCFSLINGPLHGNPFAVNIALTILSCLAFIHPLYVYLHCRRLVAQRTKYNK